MVENAERVQEMIRSLNDEAPDMRPTPETALWVAVIAQALFDFKCVCDKIEAQIKRTGAYSLVHFYELSRLLFELESEHFKRICDDAGLAHSHLMRHVSNRIHASNVLAVKPRSPIMQRLCEKGLH